MEEKPISKVTSKFGNSFLPLIIIGITVYWGGVKSIDKLQKFILSGGWVLFVCIYLYEQFYTSVWLLYEDKLVVKRPLRPFYNHFEFPLKDIVEIKIITPNAGKLNPWVTIRCTKKGFKRYDFGFDVRTEKFDDLLSLLKKRNVSVVNNID
ncbi:MAG: hypothetical protein BGO70_10820 [Bacteroidetes bacterium 43-93]|nr:hypothetical protein [Bacteroidota bacterium]OJW95608.1 MAG: hypothetical protein BGO70_10820 [Bacteroidetes bacterium 43-93]